MMFDGKKMLGVGNRGGRGQEDRWLDGSDVFLSNHLPNLRHLLALEVGHKLQDRSSSYYELLCNG